MTILLTGSLGNLGQALQRRSPEHTWLGIDRGDWDKLNDFRERADLILHTAFDLVTPIASQPRSVMESNVMATTWLLEGLSAHPVKRFAFVSSCAVYGESRDTAETSNAAPTTLNGTTKLLNEQLVKSCCERLGIEYQIFRLFNTYGGRDNFSILSHLVRAHRTNTPFTLYNGGEAYRDFIHVDDIAQLMMTTLEQPIRHSILNLGSGKAVQIKTLVEAFRRQHPELMVTEQQRAEPLFSEANINKLDELAPRYSFRSILEDVVALKTEPVSA